MAYLSGQDSQVVRIYPNAMERLSSDYWTGCCIASIRKVPDLLIGPDNLNLTALFDHGR